MTESLTSEATFVLDSESRISPQIAAWLRDRIISGHFEPRQKLKPERLAETFGASATPVREALMTLHGEGLVSYAPGRGFAVGALSHQDFKDLLDAHAHFAALLAERAVESLLDADVERLRGIQAQIIAAAEQPDADVRSRQIEALDDEFHRIINQSTGCERLKWLYRTTFRFIPYRLFGEIEGFAEAAIEDHVVIIKGLINRSPEATAAAMEAHWLNVATVLLRHMHSRGVLTDD